MNISTEKALRTNRQIRVPEIRLIDEAGEQKGVIETREALKQAEAAGLDLVEISPNAKPPVCRIMDYGKYQFQLNKKKNLAKKKQKQIHIKELKYRPGIEEGDYQVKFKKLVKFLEAGDKVKITMRFRGREMAHNELGMELLQRIAKEIVDIGQIEQAPKLEGRQLVMILGTKKK